MSAVRTACAAVCVHGFGLDVDLHDSKLQKTEVSDSDMGCFAWADKRGAVV